MSPEASSRKDRTTVPEYLYSGNTLELPTLATHLNDNLSKVDANHSLFFSAKYITHGTKNIVMSAEQAVAILAQTASNYTDSAGTTYNYSILNPIPWTKWPRTDTALPDAAVWKRFQINPDSIWKHSITAKADILASVESAATSRQWDARNADACSLLQSIYDRARRVLAKHSVSNKIENEMTNVLKDGLTATSLTAFTEFTDHYSLLNVQRPIPYTEDQLMGHYYNAVRRLSPDIANKITNKVEIRSAMGDSDKMLECIEDLFTDMEADAESARLLAGGHSLQAGQASDARRAPMPASRGTRGALPDVPPSDPTGWYDNMDVCRHCNLLGIKGNAAHHLNRMCNFLGTDALDSARARDKEKRDKAAKGKARKAKASENKAAAAAAPPAAPAASAKMVSWTATNTTQAKPVVVSDVEHAIGLAMLAAPGTSSSISMSSLASESDPESEDSSEAAFSEDTDDDQQVAGHSAVARARVSKPVSAPLDHTPPEVNTPTRLLKLRCYVVNKGPRKGIYYGDFHTDHIHRAGTAPTRSADDGDGRVRTAVNLQDAIRLAVLHAGPGHDEPIYFRGPRIEQFWQNSLDIAIDRPIPVTEEINTIIERAAEQRAQLIRPRDGDLTSPPPREPPAVFTPTPAGAWPLHRLGLTTCAPASVTSVLTTDSPPLPPIDPRNSPDESLAEADSAAHSAGGEEIATAFDKATAAEIASRPLDAILPPLPPTSLTDTPPSPPIAKVSAVSLRVAAAARAAAKNRACHTLWHTLGTKLAASTPPTSAPPPPPLSVEDSLQVTPNTDKTTCATFTAETIAPTTRTQPHSRCRSLALLLTASASLSVIALLIALVAVGNGHDDGGTSPPIFPLLLPLFTLFPSLALLSNWINCLKHTFLNWQARRRNRRPPRRVPGAGSSGLRYARLRANEHTIFSYHRASGRHRLQTLATDWRSWTLFTPIALALCSFSYIVHCLLDFIALRIFNMGLHPHCLPRTAKLPVG